MLTSQRLAVGDVDCRPELADAPRDEVHVPIEICERAEGGEVRSILAGERGEIESHSARQRREYGADGRTNAGPDIGWVLACAGLLLAAAILGLTSDGRDTAARARSRLKAGRARLAVALRPLLGRR